MLIRREQPQDHEVILGLHDAAFGGEGTAESQLVTWLRADGDVVAELSLVAEVDGRPVGHVCYSPATIDGRPVVAVGPVGVLPGHQRAGVGSALMHASVAAADALGHPAVVLLGNPRYYSRFGFVLADSLGVTAGRDDWLPYLQVRPLTAWDSSLRGAFAYAPAFARLP